MKNYPNNNQFCQIDTKSTCQRRSNGSLPQVSLASSTNFQSSGAFNVKESNPNEDNQKSTSRSEQSHLNKQYWYKGEFMELINNPLEELDQCSEVILEQKIHLLEAISGCEIPHRYHIYSIDKDHNKKYLFKSKEISSFCCRNCCFSNIRTMNFKLIQKKIFIRTMNNKVEVASFTRPTKCSCLCSEYPSLNGVYSKEEGFKPFGKIIEKPLCNPTIQVVGDNNSVKWDIKTNYCQGSICCRQFGIGKWYPMDFNIYEPNDDYPMGSIHRVRKEISEMVTHSDAYIISFPPKALLSEKILLIGTALMIDYRYFEDMYLCNYSCII